MDFIKQTKNIKFRSQKSSEKHNAFMRQPRPRHQNVHIRGMAYPLRAYYLHNGPLARYVKLWVAHALGMSGTFSQPQQVSDPDMHHGMCVTYVSWCMPGSLTSGFLWSRWRGKRFRHSRRMRNPQFYVSGKRPMHRCFSFIPLSISAIWDYHIWNALSQTLVSKFRIDGYGATIYNPPVSHLGYSLLRPTAYFNTLYVGRCFTRIVNCCPEGVWGRTNLTQGIIF